MTRRDPITGAGVVAFTAASQSRIADANDGISVGLIGCGARSRELQPPFQKLNGPLTAVCDVWLMRAEEAQSRATGAKAFDDHRKLPEMPGLDPVIVATPDDWHEHIAVDALNAGKDAYVEKPLTLKIEGGPCIIRAARVNNRICQVGAQQRSGGHYLQARDEYLKTGMLGKVTFVRTWWTEGRGAAEKGAAPRVVGCRTDLVEEHVQTFLDCCGSRKMPNGDVAIGHRSAIAAHLGNLSMIEKRRIHFEPERELVLPA